MDTTLGNLIVRFFENHVAHERGLRPTAAGSYATAIKLLLNFASERLQVTFDKLDLTSIDSELILEFLDHLEKKRHNVPRTRNQRLTVIKTFFRFLALQDPRLTEHCQRICAIKAKKTEHRVIETLELHEVQAFIDATDPTTLIGARDQALFTFLYDTAGRVQEVVDVNLTDLRLDAPSQVTLTGKGQKQRVLPLREDTVKALRHYLHLRDINGRHHPRLFLNARGAPLSRHGINYLVGKYRALAAEGHPSLGVKNVTPHTFRHAAALHMIQAGVTIERARELLGHADLQTTSLYFDINVEMKREALDKCKMPNAQATTPSEAPQWREPEILEFLDSLARRSILCEVTAP